MYGISTYTLIKPQTSETHQVERDGDGQKEVSRSVV